MGDVGRSTSAHSETVSVEVRHVRLLLIQWGAWMRSIPLPHAMRSVGGSPVLRDAVSRYADADKPPPSVPFNPDTALEVDRLIAATSGKRAVACLILRHVARMPSREAAHSMSRRGYECSHATVCRWTDDAEEQLAEKLVLQNPHMLLQVRA